MSTRSQPSASTSLRRMPVKSPNRKAARAAGVTATASMPAFQRGSARAGVEI